MKDARVTFTIFACSPCFKGKHKNCVEPCGCTKCWRFIKERKQ